MEFIGTLYFKNKVTVELKTKLAEKLPGLIVAWEDNASILFGKVFSHFKRGFKQKK